MESGWDPEVKIFFRKIISTISYGLIWLIAVVYAGIYYKLAFPDDTSVIWLILFYVLATATFLLLLRFYYRLWKK